MKSKEIKIGEIYAIRNTYRGYIKPLKILKPREAENNTSHIVVKCEHSDDRSFRFRFIRYFRLHDIIPVEQRQFRSC